MKSIEDTLCEIDELLVREEYFLKEARKSGGINAPGGGQCLGAIDVLRGLKEWILDV